MELRSTFQSIISLHQEELPFALQERSAQLPLDGNRIKTDTPRELAARGSISLFIEHNGICRYFFIF